MYNWSGVTVLVRINFLPLVALYIMFAELRFLSSVSDLPTFEHVLYSGLPVPCTSFIRIVFTGTYVFRVTVLLTII